MKKQILYYSILVLSGIVFTACGSNSKYDADDLAPGNTAFSIVYDSTSQSGNNKMISHFHVHAVDDAGKPMAGLKLNLSLINGVKEINGYKVQRGTGNILTTTPISFNDNSVNFSQVGMIRGDSLIILPSAGKTSLTYLGDWRITDIGQGLTLEENSFHLESTENLTYIVGNEERLLGGKNGSRGILTVAHIQNIDTNGTSVTDKNGYTYFDVVYDPVLAGHTVTIGVHTARSNRLGVSKVVGLRGAEFTAGEIIIQNTGRTVSVSMRLSINPGGEGGTEPLIDVNINPSSFTVDPLDSCQLNVAESNFHTDSGGHVHLVIDTKGVVETKDGNTTKTTGSETCTVKWAGGIGSLYLEY